MPLNGEMCKIFMEKIITFAAVLGLVLLPLAGASNRWEEQSPWSYRWVYDFSENKEQLEHMIHGETVDVTLMRSKGGYVFLFAIEYVGEEDGFHRFDYMGGYYSEGSLHFAMEFEFMGVSTSGDLLMEINQVESDFEGSLWVGEYEYQVGATPVNAYGIVSQTLRTTGTLDTETDMETTDPEDAMDYTMDYNLKNHWDLDLDIDYYPPLPWIPTSSGAASDLDMVHVESDYGGILSGQVEMSIDYDFPYGGVGEDEVNEDIDMSIEGQELMQAKLQFQGDNTFLKHSPVMGLVNLGNEAIMKYAEIDIYPDHNEILVSSIGVSSQAKYDSETDSYVSYYRNSIDKFYFEPYVMAANEFIGDEVLMIESEMLESEWVSKDEVEAFRQDKQGYFNQYIDSSDPPAWLMYAMIPVLIFFVVLVIGFILFSRKKQKPNTYYPQQTGEYQQMEE